jgi:hypothetical protein
MPAIKYLDKVRKLPKGKDIIDGECWIRLKGRGILKLELWNPKDGSHTAEVAFCEKSLKLLSNPGELNIIMLPAPYDNMQVRVSKLLSEGIETELKPTITYAEKVK